MIGAELGYRYVDSPIICNIPGGPEHLFREYQPTTWPGARLPHVWLDDGTPTAGPHSRRLHDPQARRHQSRRRAACSARIARARRAGARCSKSPDQAARDVYGYDLVLVRPDLHVVWRGNAAPEDPARIAAVATGN